jgi:uncharacterized membrane protein YedE/YeeE
VKAAAAAIAGVLFAIGLMIADMTSPGRILAFLDIGGAWDPTLAFVMAAAIGVYAPIYYLVKKRPRPLFARAFHVPDATKIDAPLVGGAVIFGVGWGLSGLCPGPALVAAGAGRVDTLVFVATMIAGIVVMRLARR